MVKLSLAGEWSLRDCENNEWMKATVPGCNFTDLLDNEIIPNPFDGMNETKVAWVGEKDWEYKRDFNVDEDMLKCPVVLLECDMLDTLAEVSVNGTIVAKTSNAHIGYTFDVKDLLLEGKNAIKIKFDSPVKYIKQKQAIDPMPNNTMAMAGVPSIRKPQCHFGWDWGPNLPFSGIIKDIRLVGYDMVRIDSVEIKQEHTDGKVALYIKPELTGDEAAMEAVKVTLTNPDKTEEVQIKKYNGEEIRIEVKSPKLWWSNDLSDEDVQPLYTVKVEIICNGKSVDSVSKRIGLRTLSVDMSEDEYGNNFRFILNGVPIFARGANWIPADSFITRFTPDKVEYFLDSIKDANMNMVRIWGGGYYESDEFYDKCDEKGILVWQDFCFACAPYPFYDEEFNKSVKAEIAYNVKRLRSHPSLALWSGNNEIEMMTIGWKLMGKLVKWEEIFFHHELPEELRKYDDVTPYIDGSPTSSKGFLKSVNSDKAGDTHLWHVWHGLQPLTYYRNRYTRFCSEFGLESLPDMQTIRGFAKPEDYSLTSDVFMAHQKCTSGNSKMLYYMSTRFRIPAKFEHTVYLTQLIQNECIKDATEHWRRQRGRCNGSLYWQLNDCWPVSSWSSIDYEGRYKALQYGAKHFNASTMISLEDKKGKVDIYVVHDRPENFEGAIRYSLEDWSGNKVFEGECLVDVKGVSSEKLVQLDLSEHLSDKNKVFVAELYDTDGCIVSRKTALFAPEKNLKFDNPNLTLSAEVIDNRAYVTIKADKYARFVKVDLDGTYKPFSDNCFDMLAGEEVTVSIPVDGMSEEEVLKRLSVMSVYDIQPKGSRFSDFMFRVKVALTPINVANFFYYLFV